ncbi:immunoglobulin superfamily member 1-like [Trachemys scripta elegans]|uniref:immunoglobulin superfamily member 1-like n=1 Tax=Trachemys scripta elegans TaxID=31138 RepID=UPI00155442E3|nr:immunoglobulin superfamily member 1-like [Trachemys scripta elegans]
MASALDVLFLRQEYPKPTIWVSPSSVVALGGNVTIRCEGLYSGMEFFLRKIGHPNPQRQPVPDGTVAEFPIANVSREDGGSYTCDYRSITDQNRTSHPSDPVKIIVGEGSGPRGLSAGSGPSPLPWKPSTQSGAVLGRGRWLGRRVGSSPAWGLRLTACLLPTAEPSYPKPNISLSSSGGVSPGGAVSVWCRGQPRGVRFVLNKEGRHFQPVDSDDNEAVFPISNMHREDGGSYSCSYHSRSEPHAVSYPSDPVELVLRDPSLPRPSISLSPTGVTAPGADVTIRCQGQRRDVRFFLHKAGDLNLQRRVASDEDWAEFLITTVGQQQGGSYNCSYRPQSEPFVSSQPSDPVQLVVADPSLPRPSISLSPTGVTAPGADVTIRCQGQRRNVTFFLHKAGDLNLQRQMDPAGDGAEFRIPTMGQQHRGNYSCSYRLQSEPFISSQPSDPVQLVEAG